MYWTQSQIWHRGWGCHLSTTHQLLQQNHYITLDRTAWLHQSSKYSADLKNGFRMSLAKNTNRLSGTWNINSGCCCFCYFWMHGFLFCLHLFILFAFWWFRWMAFISFLCILQMSCLGACKFGELNGWTNLLKGHYALQQQHRNVYCYPLKLPQRYIYNSELHSLNCRGLQSWKYLQNYIQ